MIEIPLDHADAALLPPLHAHFKSFWSDTSEEPRAKFNAFIANTPIADGVVFRPAAASDPPGLWCDPPAADAERAMLYLHGGAYVMGSADAYRGFVSQIAARAQCPAFILDYALDRGPQSRCIGHARAVAGHAPRVSARCEDPRELSASARPCGSFLEKWMVTASDEMIARGLAGALSKLP